VRIENLADSFDNTAQVKELDLNALAQYLWHEANPGAHPAIITEMSLSANQLKSENVAYMKKYTWKGEDDKTLKVKAAPVDRS
jgi:hypothetical protein